MWRESYQSTCRFRLLLNIQGGIKMESNERTCFICEDVISEETIQKHPDTEICFECIECIGNIVKITKSIPLPRSL